MLDFTLFDNGGGFNKIDVGSWLEKSNRLYEQAAASGLLT